MRLTRTRWLALALIIIVVVIVELGLTAWRRHELLAEYERRGVRLECARSNCWLMESPCWLLDAREEPSFGDIDLERIRSLGVVVIADLRKTSVSNAGVRSLLESQPRVSTLSLRVSDTAVGEEAFDLYKGARYVPHLDLSGTLMTFDGTQRMGALRLNMISYLSVANTLFADEGFNLLSDPAMGGPAALNLAGTRISDASLPRVPLNTCCLCVKDTNVTAIGLGTIKSKLFWLDLTNTHVSDEGLRDFISAGNQSKLEVLRVHGTQVTASGLNWLNETVPGICVIDRQPETATSRQRVLDALGNGNLFGQLPDPLWQDLQKLGEWKKGSSGIQSFEIGLADSYVEGRFLLGYTLTIFTIPKLKAVQAVVMAYSW